MLYSKIILKVFRFINAMHLNFLDQRDHSNATYVEILETNTFQEIFVEGNTWIALQANMLYDQGQTNNDFEEKHKSIMLNMAKYFVIPKLTRNMRNSDNINKVFQGVKEMDSYYETVLIECNKFEWNIMLLSNILRVFIPL